MQLPEWQDIEFYATILLALFTIGFIRYTYRYYKAGKTKIRRMHRYANEGDVQAQEFLAHEYEKGEFVPKDCKRAAFWYTKASIGGSKKAKSFLQRYREKSDRAC